MGGIALLAREAGHTVSGSDTNVYPPMSTQLEAQGISLMEGYDPSNLDPAPDMVVVGNVMSRGNRGGAIFEDDTDREVFLDTLGQACGKTGWIVHCYVLLGNHYHILLETPEANLVSGMQWLQST